jgi:hypothetical protein
MDAKVQFSAEEMRLVSDPAWILTKNSIIRKVVELFGELSGEWRQMLASERMGRLVGTSEAKVTWGDPKISRGEQYKGLPWVMLDYPRVFGKEDVLAVRTMFWWGHYFSVTLHLKGSYLRTYLPVILSNRGLLEAAGFWPGTSEDEWEHDHRPGAWEIRNPHFLKVSARCEINQSEMLAEKFAVLVRVLIATQPVK